MKKLLLSGITAVALMAAGTVEASDLNLMGETGLARTPIAASLAPMQFAVAVDYVNSDDFAVPMRAEIGLPYGIEIGGGYTYIDSDFDPETWNLNAKWVLPKFVENLGLAVGGHYFAQQIDDAFGNTVDNDGHDLYAVASYTAPMGEGLSLIPSFGVEWLSRTGDNDQDAWKFFGSVLVKAPKFAVGGEYISKDEDVDGNYVDGFFWLGGRFYLNEMVTLQAGYINDTNWSADWDDFADGVFHIGAQFAFSTAM
jgi:hypothetical protein